MSRFTESIVEEATLEWLEGLGYTPLNASEIAPDSPNSERQTYADVVLINRLRSALATINDKIPTDAIVDYSKFFNGTSTERLSVIPAATNHNLELEDGKQRYIKAVTELSKAFALVSSLDEAIAIRDEAGFFQSIKAAMVKHTTTGGKSPEDLDAAVRQIVSKAIASEQVLDLFAAAGLNNPYY